MIFELSKASILKASGKNNLSPPVSIIIPFEMTQPNIRALNKPNKRPRSLFTMLMTLDLIKLFIIDEMSVRASMQPMNNIRIANAEDIREATEAPISFASFSAKDAGLRSVKTNSELTESGLYPKPWRNERKDSGISTKSFSISPSEESEDILFLVAFTTGVNTNFSFKKFASGAYSIKDAIPEITKETIRMIDEKSPFFHDLNTMSAMSRINIMSINEYISNSFLKLLAFNWQYFVRIADKYEVVIIQQSMSPRRDLFGYISVIC